MSDTVSVSVKSRLGQVIAAHGNANAIGLRIEDEGQVGIIERRMLGQFMTRHRPEHAFVAIKILFAFGQIDLQPVVHFRIEVLQQLLPCILHGSINLAVHFCSQAFELFFDLLGGTAVLIDGNDALFKLDAGFDGTQDFFTGPEHTGKELELLRQQFVYALIGC